MSQTQIASSADSGGLVARAGSGDARRSLGRDRDADIAALVRHVRDVLHRHGLEWEDFRQAHRYQAQRTGTLELDPDSYERVLAAGKDVIRDGQAPADRRAFRELIHEVESLLNVEIGESALDGRLLHLVKAIPSVVATVLFVCVSFLIFGGLLSGESDLVDSPIAALLAFLFLLGLLAAVEALHISVTLLRLKDLNAVRDEYPRTFATHKIFRHEEGTERFLAGRQLFVIVTVFFAAKLTSFPDMHEVPLFGWELPDWFATLFLKWGIAGALFLLWFGQLTPQFYANRRPRSFMNKWFISALFRAALAWESIGVTKPGGWLASRVPAESPIPVSAEEQYRQAIEEIDGNGAVGVKKVWRISDERSASLECETSYVFAVPGAAGTSDETIAVAGGVSKLEGRAELLGGDGTERELVTVGPDLEQREDGTAAVVQSVRPRFGSFQKDDVLILHTELEVPQVYGLDQTSITRPTQYLLVRVELAGEPKSVGSARVQGFALGETPTAEVLSGKRPILDEDLELTHNDDGTPCFEFTAWYPSLNSHYVLAWDAEYA
jgi:hypothetical protein